MSNLKGKIDIPFSVVFWGSFFASAGWHMFRTLALYFGVPL